MPESLRGKRPLPPLDQKRPRRFKDDGARGLAGFCRRFLLHTIREIRGSHWLMTYGDYLNEMGYGVRKLGLDWLNISEV